MSPPNSNGDGWMPQGQEPDEHSAVLQSIRADIHRILRFIEGDGSDDNPGWRLRLDRLEQLAKQLKESADKRSGYLYALAVPVTMLVLERIIHWPK